jgi:hypothetical protein
MEIRVGINCKVNRVNKMLRDCLVEVCSRAQTRNYCFNQSIIFYFEGIVPQKYSPVDRQSIFNNNEICLRSARILFGIHECSAFLVRLVLNRQRTWNECVLQLQTVILLLLFELLYSFNDRYAAN